MRVDFAFLSDVQGSEDFRSFERWLQKSHASLLEAPSGSPPYLLVAIVPDGTDGKAFLENLRSQPGVGRADIEQIRVAY